MAQLEFCDKHNMVAYLVKSESSEGFDEIIDFLTSSHIYYALTENPIIFVSLIEQFWETAVLSTTEEGLQAISATIDGHEKLITEDSLRRHLKLDDAEGISSLSNEEIFEHLAHMGYVTNSESLTFFKAMVKNLDSPHKFLLYPRFIQPLLNKQQRLLLPHTRTYPTPTLTSKLFSNMRRASKGYSGVVTPLFENMLVQAHDEEQQQSPLRITSSPSLSPQPTQPSPLLEPIQLTHKVEETTFMPIDSPLHDVHSHGSAEGSVQQHDLTVLVTKLNDQIDGLDKDLQQTKKTYSTALTKLVLKVKKLEYKLKFGKARRKAKIVLSDDEEITEASSKQGRKIYQIDEDLMISLVQDEGTSWIPQEEEVYEKPNDETKVLVQEETPTEIIEEHGSSKNGEIEISTANMQVSTASPPKVSTAIPHVYTRRSAKDKRKAIMEEPATPKKGIDWNDPRVLRYHALKNRPVSIAQARRNMISYLKNQGGYKESYFKKMSYDDIRPIFERVWDHVNTFIPIGFEFEKDSSKPSEKETSKTELIEKKVVGIRRKTLARRRASDKQVYWESQSLGNMHVYKIIRADGNTSYHKTFESMLKSFDRHDLEGDLKILVDPEQDDDIWKNQSQWKIISWKLYETYGVHTLMVDGTLITIRMFVEKKYPLTKETLQKLLN
ncbi:hypothetical protein Tco_0543210 [Tanacetum coccineum]